MMLKYCRATLLMLNRCQIGGEKHTAQGARDIVILSCVTRTAHGRSDTGPADHALDTINTTSAACRLTNMAPADKNRQGRDMHITADRALAVCTWIYLCLCFAMRGYF